MPLPLQTSDFVDQLFDAIAAHGVTITDAAGLKSAAADLFTAWLGGSEAIPADLGQKLATQIGVQTAKTINDFDWYNTPANGGPRGDGTIDFVLPDGTTVPLDARAKLVESLAKGDPGGVNFTFSTTVADADPGPGALRFNDGTLATVTALYFDNMERGGATVTAWLDGFGAADGDVKGLLYLQEVGSANIAVFKVTGQVVDGSGYRKVPVAYAAGTALFANDARVAVTFTRTGLSDYETWKSLPGNEAGSAADYIAWQVDQVTANASAVLQPIADDAATSATQAQASQLAIAAVQNVVMGSFSAPVVAVGGRPVQPTIVSFDGYVIEGVYTDTGAPYRPIDPSVAADVVGRSALLMSTTMGLMRTPPVTVSGRLVQPTVVSFDGYVTEGVYLDTLEPYLPLSPDVSRLNPLLANVILASPVIFGGRLLQPLEVSFDGYVHRGYYLDNGDLFDASAALGLGATSSKLVVVESAGQLRVLFKGRNPASQKYICWQFGNTPDAAKNSDVWRINGVYEAALTSGTFSLGQQLCQAGEYELAIKETGKTDFSGGNAHGNHKQTAAYQKVDGVLRTIGTAGQYTATTLEFFQASDLIRYGAPGSEYTDGTVIAKVWSRWKFADGKVRLFHRIEWQISINLAQTYLTMLTVLRDSGAVNITNRGAREPYWLQEDLSVSGFTQVNSKAAAAQTWGDAYSAEVKVEKGWDKPNRVFNFSPAAAYNKNYFDFTGAGYAATAGEIWDVESVLEVQTIN